MVMKQSVTNPVVGADTALVSVTSLAIALTSAVAAAAIWSATRHVSRLDIVDVIRAECRE
jgi:hypothetical protein